MRNSMMGLACGTHWVRCKQDFYKKKAEWKRSLGITRRRREDNIKMGFLKIA